MAPPGTHGVLLQLTTGDWAFILLLITLGLAIKAIILWWLHEDTIAHGRRPHYWLAAAIVLDIPTLIVWLIVRGEPKDGQSEHLEQSGGPAFPPPSLPGDRPPLDPPYRSETAPGMENENATNGPRTPIKCPQCGTMFSVRRNHGPTRIECPECGRSGTLG
jgi:hypothetical protein